MSLINDALQRAQQVQQSSPPGPAHGLRFRPVEPPRQENRGASRMLPMLLVATLIASATLYREVNRDDHVTMKYPGQTPPVVGARMVPPPAVPPLRPSSARAEAAEANTSAATAPKQPPGPAPLKLQAVLFNPTRPSAIISGKTTFVGDRVGEFQVQAIFSDSATLVSAVCTNVLRLE